VSDSIENFLSKAKGRDQIIKMIQESPENSYILVATIPNGEPGTGKMAVYTGGESSTFALHGFYALIRLLLEGAQDDLLVSALGLEDGE
jgi:hypothetical protein